MRSSCSELYLLNRSASLRVANYVSTVDSGADRSLVRQQTRLHHRRPHRHPLSRKPIRCCEVRFSAPHPPSPVCRGLYDHHRCGMLQPASASRDEADGCVDMLRCCHCSPLGRYVSVPHDRSNCLPRPCESHPALENSCSENEYQLFTMDSVFIYTRWWALTRILPRIWSPCSK